MLSMKDYAKQKNVSYEAVRKQVVRYKNELDGHIFKKERTQFLDEYAIDFLDQKRASNPVIIYEISKDEEIDRLKKENESYLKKITLLQEQLLLQHDQVVALETAKQIAETEKELAVMKAVSEATQKAESEKSEAVDVVRKELEEALRERDAAKEKLAEPITFREWFRTKGRKVMGSG